MRGIAHTPHYIHKGTVQQGGAEEVRGTCQDGPDHHAARTIPAESDLTGLFSVREMREMSVRCERDEVEREDGRGWDRERVGGRGWARERRRMHKLYLSESPLY